MTTADTDLIELFAQRLWARDHPVVEPLRFDRESVLGRLREGIAARDLAPTPAGQMRIARILYAYLGQAEWTVAGLGAEVGSVESRMRTLLRGLRKAGLVVMTHQVLDGRRLRYALTRTGEDWVQALVQAPAVAAEGVDAGRDLT